MLLVADSGSTKADWILIRPDETRITFRTRGINALFLTEKDIVQIFHHVPEVKPYVDDIREVYFFGAGCSSPDRREMMSNALTRVFKNAFISVDIDIVASVYATCGNGPGICCILGTGSNIAYFDGSKIHESKHGLGYVLGDEGSGTFFGRKLITGYLYETMPAELISSFRDEYGIEKDAVITRIYQQPTPNSFLASFAPFMSKHVDHPYIQRLLREGFDEFVETNIKSYPDYKKQTCHFVGSIGYHFSHFLKDACTKQGITVGKILKHPIDELSTFIQRNGVIIN